MKILRFEPQMDITAHELAQIFKMNTMMGISGYGLGLSLPDKISPSEAYYNALPLNVKRHLIEIIQTG